MGEHRIRVDMHTHSEYSPDCGTSTEAQARAIRAAKLDVVCATDHDAITGALRLRELADGFRVIVGEEISTRGGELIGLFLEHAIPPGLTAEETIARIRDQGGLVSVPHPFSRTRPNRLRRDALERLWPLVDCIEIFNARVSEGENRQAEAYARQKRIPGAAGSDAHRVSDIGGAWMEIDDFGTAEELVAALAGGTVGGRPHGVRSRSLTNYVMALRRRSSREDAKDG